ncbi:unnamed protein product [Brassica oleracea var. botrytis]
MGEFGFTDFAPSLSLSESLFLQSLLDFRRLSNSFEFYLRELFRKHCFRWRLFLLQPPNLAMSSSGSSSRSFTRRTTVGIPT